MQQLTNQNQLFQAKNLYKNKWNHSPQQLIVLGQTLRPAGSTSLDLREKKKKTVYFVIPYTALANLR